MRGFSFLKGGPITEGGGGGLTFCDGGDYVTKLADSQREYAKLGGEKYLKFDWKWCILNQFRPSTKS